MLQYNHINFTNIQVLQQGQQSCLKRGKVVFSKHGKPILNHIHE